MYMSLFSLFSVKESLTLKLIFPFFCMFGKLIQFVSRVSSDITAESRSVAPHAGFCFGSAYPGSEGFSQLTRPSSLTTRHINFHLPAGGKMTVLTGHYEKKKPHTFWIILNMFQGGSGTCVFWQESLEDGTGGVHAGFQRYFNKKMNPHLLVLCLPLGHWRTDGCLTNNTGNEYICSCRRLGFFAVLVVK